MTRSSEKMVPPRLATAMAFALIVVALSGSTQAGVFSMGSDAELRHVDRNVRARMLAAAALAATRDLLGVNHGQAALELSENRVSVEAVGNCFGTVENVARATQRLSPRLTNLPPPPMA